MASRGSTEWAIWHVKAIGIPRLIEDLEKLERTGYPEAKCSKLKETLREIIRVTDRAAGSLWRPCMLAELHEFLEIYDRWNGRMEGADLVDRMHRRQRIEEMRAVRKRISKNLGNVFAKLTTDPQFNLSRTAEVDLARDIYGKFQSLVESFPETFKILGTAVAGFADGSFRTAER